MAETTATAEGESKWYESFLSGIGEVTSEALAIKTAGYLRGLQEDEGLRPSSDQQVPTRVDNTGANLTSAGSTDAMMKTYLIYGGAGLLILVILARLMRG